MMQAATALKNAYLTKFPGDASRGLEALDDDRLIAEIDGLEVPAILALLSRLPLPRAARVLAAQPAAVQTAIAEQASPRLAVGLLAVLEDDARAALLDSLPRTAREDLERFMSFPENTAGRLMDRAVGTVRRDVTVGDALDQVRRGAVRRARSVYVVDDDNRLAGRVDMQDLALADRDERLATYINPVYPVAAVTPREEIVALLDRHRIDSIPVIDAQGDLMGVVRYDSLFTAIEDVRSADIQKMVGASADEHALSPAGFAVKRRLPWLHINLLTAFLAASVVGLFESLIAQFTALAVLLPVVAGQSGNAGSQALAVTIRGLALREIGTREWRKVLTKELFVGIVNGCVLAVTCGAGVYFWSMSMGLALVIAVAMILSMIAAGISGALVPVVLTRIGQDPATASSIILTTVTDVAGFFSFLGTATALSFML